MKKILFVLLLLLSVNVKAEVDCNKLMEIRHICTTSPRGLMTMISGDELNCNITFKSLENETCDPIKETLKEITFKFDVPTSLNLFGDIPGEGFTKNGDNTLTFIRNTGISEGTIYTYKLKTIDVTEDTNYNISISNVSVKNNEDTVIDKVIYGTSIPFKVIKPKSDINTLSSLNVSNYNLTPLFSSDILNYKLMVDTKISKVNINPTKTDIKSTISGDIGEKTLNYGDNTFKINVLSESGTTKTYTIVINRQDYRSNENGLKSLTVSNIYFNFKPDTLRYDLEVDREISNVSVKSQLIDPTSSYIEGSENITKNLVIGNNTVIIKVKAENGDIKTYTINIVKNDGKSSVNSLSSLSILGYEKLIDFIPETTTYNLSVPSTAKELEIKSSMTSTKSTYVEGFGNRKITLDAGLNKVEIKVKSEKGVIKTYTINITREDPKDNTVLKSLKIDVEDFKFDPNILEYKLEISNLVDKLKIETITEEKNTKVTILGNESLKVGENKITIEVKSESGKTKVYTLLVKKRDKASTISKFKNIIIENYKLDFNQDTLEYTLEIKDEKKLEISVEKLDPLTKYTVLGNSNLKYGSVIKIIASAEDGSKTEYKIKITKNLNGLIPLGIVTLLIIIISITASKKNKHVKLIKKDKGIKKEQKPLENIVIEPKPIETVPTPAVEPVVTPVVEPVKEVTEVKEIVEEPKEKEDEILEI